MSVRVADILAVGAERFLGRNRVASVVADACRAIMACRTAVLGGHVKRCGNGHVVGVWYNACRNRSCPRCSFHRVRRWLERQARTLLGCAHHHIIFTIPHELNFLWLINYAALGDLLFHCAREALFELAADARYLGAKPGAIMALHSWGQQLTVHPHVHCLVTAGGIDGAGQWVGSRRQGFLPAEPLKRLFRGKFLYGVRGLARSGRLRLPSGWSLAECEALCREAQHKRWNVYICERYDNPTAVLNYLGRYLHGGPIGERRLLDFDGTTVRFCYKDYRDRTAEGPREKVMALSVEEFVTRLLRHVPPEGFHLVRGYGLYRRGGKTEALCRRVRQTVPLRPELRTVLSHPTPLEAAPEPERCTVCGEPAKTVSVLPRAAPFRMAA